MKAKLLSQIEKYIPCNEQEEVDKALLLQWLRSGEEIITRNNQTAHLTTSAWVISPDRQQVLMAYHNLYDSWAWLGGHADGDWDLMHVARKEVEEETGLKTFTPIVGDIVSLEILVVSGHEKKGSYVPSHLHLNVTYLFEGDPSLPIRVKPDENSAVAWIPVSQIGEKSSEPWFRDRIYSKLCDKAASL